MLAQIGQIPRAMSYRAGVQELAERIGELKALIHAEQLAGALAFIEGDFDSGRRHMQRGIELAENADMSRRFKGLIFNMASLSEVLGEYEAALAYHKRGIALLDRSANPGLYAMHLIGMAALAVRSGDLTEGDRLLRQAWPDIAEWRSSQVLVGALTTKGELLIDIGEAEQAAWLFGAADHIIEQYGRVLAEIEIEEIGKLRDRLASQLPPDQLEHALAAGRSLSMEELTRIIETPVAAGPAPEPERSLLTLRETEVARLLVDGKTNPEIAAELFISERTVQSHVANIMAKLEVNSRTAAAARVVRDGLLPA
jgi:non-specific serine/threonine protein kinase